MPRTKIIALSLLAGSAVTAFAGLFYWAGMVNYVQDENPEIDTKIIEKALRTYFINAARGNFPAEYDGWSDEQKNDHFNETYIKPLLAS